MTVQSVYSQNVVAYPLVVTDVFNNSTVKSASNSENIYIGIAKHLDVLIYLTTAVNTTAIQFHVNIIESNSGKTIRTYDGVSKSSSASTDYITVDSLTLGDTINISWTGTLDNSNYFTGVYCRVIVK